LIIGHRGYPQFAPENTIPSWKLAIEAGADMAELDYYHSKDGQLVVMHDGTLDRTTDATNRWGGKKIVVSSKTVAELQSLDAGSWLDKKYAGTKVPTLMRRWILSKATAASRWSNARKATRRLA
jgi:glycerophosphoryl diester phosphodiesterase